MKNKKVILLWLMTLCILFTATSTIYADQSSIKPDTIDIIFTHDLHDNILPHQGYVDGKLTPLGGYAKIKTIIDGLRKQSPTTLLVDGGDFSMGSLFHTLFATDAPTLKLMGVMGYDAVTLGNHEFDFGPRGLASSLQSALDVDSRPTILQSNTKFPEVTDATMKKDLADLKVAMEAYGVKDYTIIEKNGLKIGIFGLLGEHAAERIPLSGVEFTDILSNAKRVVDILKNKEKVDLIVCLSHTGTETQDHKPEDETIASKVPDINVIVSGHTHTVLNEPQQVNNTYIVSCGQYGENIGRIQLERKDKEWVKKDYELIPVTMDIPDNQEIITIIENLKEKVQTNYLDMYGFNFDETIGFAPFGLTPTNEMRGSYGEKTLGNFITDAFIHSVKMFEGDNYEPIDIAFEPAGLIRNTIYQGDITVGDVFMVNGVGVGAEELAGYPLMTVYLTGKEVRNMCETDASVYPLLNAAQLNPVGIRYTMNPNRFIFNKVTHVEFVREDGSIEPIEDKKLYRMVIGFPASQMLPVITKKTFGLLSVVPKQKDGTPIQDYEKQIIRHYKTGIELKEWVAVAYYVESFTQKGKAIPETYKYLQKRKNIDDNASLVAILRNPNSLYLIVYGVTILALALIIVLLLFIIKRLRRKRHSQCKKH